MFHLDNSEFSWLVYADWLEDQDIDATHIRTLVVDPTTNSWCWEHLVRSGVGGIGFGVGGVGGFGGSVGGFGSGGVGDGGGDFGGIVGGFGSGGVGDGG